MTMAQINIVNDCNDAMRYFAGRAQIAIEGQLPGSLDWRQTDNIVQYCNKEFKQIQALRDFIRFGR